MDGTRKLTDHEPMAFTGSHIVGTSMPAVKPSGVTILISREDFESC